MKPQKWITFLLNVVMGWVLPSAILVSATLASSANADELTATVDRNSISVNESVQLNVRYTGQQSNTPPDFSRLENLFDIVSNNQSSQFVNRNGQITSYTEWQLMLMPKKEGKLLIPAFELNGVQSQPLVINVSPPAQNPVASQRDVFLETDIASQAIYVQQQLLITYRLYFTKSIKGVDSTPFNIPDAIIEELPTRQFTRNVDGRDFRVAEVRYAVFPQTSGTLEIPSLNWDIRVATNSRINSIYGLSGRYEMRRERTEAKTIEVKPQPANYPANAAWIPATNVELTESWGSSPNTFKVGEPITRTLELKAKGLMSSQLPKLVKDSSQEAVKIYAEQPVLNDEHGDEGMSSTRTESAAVIVSQSGTTTLPSVRIPWWDVNTDTLKYAEIPAQQVQASGKVNNADYENSFEQNDSAAAQDDDTTIPTETLAALNLWRLLAIIFGCTTLLFGGLWVYLVIHNKKTSQQSEQSLRNDQQNYSRALKQVERMCRYGKADAIRDALLQWAKLHWPNRTVMTLQQLQMMIDDADLQQSLRNLDQELYGQQSGKNFEPTAFIERLKAWASEQQTKSQHDNHLQEFYAT